MFRISQKLDGSNTLASIKGSFHRDKNIDVNERKLGNIYAPLNQETRETRLLRLSPSLILEEQPRCFLETVSLDENPCFEALSYAWGNPNIKRPTKLENREWPVTNNLEAGFRYLRSPFEERTLWIDVLCIIQESIEERNSQVLLMKSIYSTAAKFKAWLGEPTRGSNEATAILQEFGIGTYFKEIRLLDKKLGKERVKHVIKLFEIPWWKRVWAQQEYILAKQVTIHCGDRSVGYETLTRLSEDPYGFISGWEGELTGLTSTLVRSAYMRDLYRVHGSHNLSFVITLAERCFYDCTNLRDSIYGFLGMAHGQLAEEIMDYYQCSVEKAFHNFAMQLILSTKYLALLSLTTFKGKEKRIVPTWVPDWPRLGQIHDDAVRNWQSRMQRFAQLPYFDACGSHLLIFDPKDDTTSQAQRHVHGKNCRH